MNGNSPFDLHWRLFEIDFRVKPWFWIMQALFGYFYVTVYKDVEKNLIAYLAAWVGLAFVSILVHELGHVIVGRIFGARSNIILQGMGGAAVGNFPELKAWQRILVYAAGPAFGLGLFVFADTALQSMVRAYDPLILSTRWYTTCAGPMGLFTEGDWKRPGMLLLMNLIWNIFNLIPIIPLDGGMIMKEICIMILPRHGERLAYGISFLLAGAIVALAVIRYFSGPRTQMDMLICGLYVFMFGSIAFQCLMAMHAAKPPDPAPRRYHEFEEKEW